MNDYFVDVYNRTGLVFERGKGAILEDSEGRSYIDFTSGIGVNCLGHGYKPLVDAILSQAQKMLHISNYYQSKQSQELAKVLCTTMGMDAVFFSNSGAEANEAAFKIARKHGLSLSSGKNVIASLEGSFHGRTLATLTATGQEKFHHYFGPFPAGFIYAPANDLQTLSKILTDNVCALIVEPIQGESGVMPLPDSFLKEAFRLCQERGILFIADEIQCGVGRTGWLCASSRLHIAPDIVTIAKGLAGGVPIGATLVKGPASKALGIGDHGSTFGGNPLAAASARVVIETISDPAFLASVQKKGTLFLETIRAWKAPSIREVRGIGLMVGIETSLPGKEVRDMAIAENLLVLTAGSNVIRLLPPLNIEESLILEGLSRLKRVFDKLSDM